MAEITLYDEDDNPHVFTANDEGEIHIAAARWHTKGVLNLNLNNRRWIRGVDGRSEYPNG